MTTKADTSVKWFHSGQADAPILNGAAGSLISVLDACLINGFGIRTPDSIVVADGVATVSISAGNPYEKHAVVVISGASDAALNTEWRVATSGASSFTFLCPGVADGTVSGASVKRAGAGWGKPFSDINKAAYQSLDPNSTQLYLRVDDTFSRYAQLRGYSQMTAIDEGSGLFPSSQQSSAGYSWAKSDDANSTSKKWAIFSDGRLFYFYQATYGTSFPALGVFGDIESFVVGDKYNCVLAASSNSTNTTAPSSNTSFPSVLPSANFLIARAKNQTTASVTCGCPSIRFRSSYNNRPTGFSDLGGPADGGIALRWPIYVVAGTNEFDELRGFMPGLLEPLHRAFTEVDVSPISGAGVFFGREIVGLSISNGSLGNGSIAIDLTGPWR